MRAIICVFDIGTGPILPRKDLAESDWYPLIRPCDIARPKCSTIQKVKVVGIIVLHIPIGDSRIHVMPRIVRKLALLVLFHTLFIDNFLSASPPVRRR